MSHTDRILRANITSAGDCGWVFTSMYFGPLSEIVDNNEIVKSFQRAGEVNAYPRPWKLCFDQALNLIGGALATMAQPLHSLTAFLISSSVFWTIDKATHKTFLPITPWMASVKIFQNTFLQCRRNNDEFSVK